MRLRCYLFGCLLGDQGWYCCRCNGELYEPDFIEEGFLSPHWRWLKWKALSAWQLFAGRKCDVCEKRYWRGNDWCCSEECQEKWVPF